MRPGVEGGCGQVPRLEGAGGARALGAFKTGLSHCVGANSASVSRFAPQEAKNGKSPCLGVGSRPGARGAGVTATKRARPPSAGRAKHQTRELKWRNIGYLLVKGAIQEKGANAQKQDLGYRLVEQRHETPWVRGSGCAGCHDDKVR